MHRPITKTFLGLVAGVVIATACFAEPIRSTTIQYVNPQVPQVTLPTYGGTRYQATIPDTLDLQERARLAVNGLTSTVDPYSDYEIYWLVRINGNKPVMDRDYNDQVQTQMQEALPLMRLISGSSQNMDTEQRWIEVLFQSQSSYGLLYYPTVGRPWISLGPFAGNQYTEPWTNGCLLAPIRIYYELTGDQRYKEMGQRLVDGMARQAVHRDGYAFFARGLYGLNEVSDQSAPMPTDIGVNVSHAWVIRYLVRFYQTTGYEPAIKLAGEFARYLQDYSGWSTPDGHWLALNRHGAFNAGALLGVLEYALAVGDQDLINWCHQSYEYGRAESYGEFLTGWFPEYFQPTVQGGETDQVALMIELALKFSVSGLFDYWDDIDRWTRNHLVENQILDSAWMYTKFNGTPAAIDPTYTTDVGVGEKNVGNFVAWPSFNDNFWFFGDPGKQIAMHCDAGVGSLGLYRVWANILHYGDGKLKVNLLLNRASSWADIDSYIPYQGRVDVRMKTACDLSMRIPEWVSPSQAQCTVNGIARSLTFDGRYAQVGNVAASDMVSLTFPIYERTDVVRVNNISYTLIRRGNDVVSISPAGYYSPTYQRSYYRQSTPRMKTVERFVTDQSITLDERLVAVKMPAFSPGTGYYNSPTQSVIISSISGAIIHYTTDGSVPDENSPIFNGPIEIGRNTVVRARAYKTGMAPSVVNSAVYAVGQQPLLLVTSRQDGSVQKYTLDGLYLGQFAATGVGAYGVVQGDNKHVYVSNVDNSYISDYLPNGALLNKNAIPEVVNPSGLAWKDNLLWVCDYNKVSAAYDPTTGAQSGPIRVWNSEVPNMSLGPDGRWYVSQWVTPPGVEAWNPATGSTETIIDSELGNASGSAFDGTDFYVADYSQGRIWKRDASGTLALWKSGLAAPTGLLVSGGKMYVSEQDANRVSVFNLSDGAPAGSFTERLAKPAYLCLFDDVRVVDDPVFTPAGGYYDYSTVTVSITCATPGAAIHYTIDGTEPSDSSPLYTNQIALDHNVTLKAKAYKTGMVASGTTSANYVVGSQTLLLVANRGDGLIQEYTLDNMYVGQFAAAPKGSYGIVQGDDNNVYVSNIDTNSILKYGPDGTLLNANFVAGRTGPKGLSWRDGRLWICGDDKISAAYNPTTGAQSGPSKIWTVQVPGMSFGPDGRWYVSKWITPPGVEAWNTSTGAAETIIDTDLTYASGSAFNAGDLYVADYGRARILKRNSSGVTSVWKSGFMAPVGVLISNGKLFVADSFNNRVNVFNLSDASSAGVITNGLNRPAYMCLFNKPIVVKTPVFIPPGGLYETPRKVTIKCDTPGAAIRYTTDGSPPIESSSLYTEPISVDHLMTLNARAFKPNATSSEIKTASYIIGQQPLLLVTNQGNTSVNEYTLDGAYIGKFGDIGVPNVTKGAFAIVQGGDGNVYVSNLDYNYTSKFFPDGTLAAAIWSTDAAGAMQLSWDYSRNLLVKAGFDMVVSGIDPATGTYSGPFKSDWPSYPTGVTIGPDGRWYVSQWIANNPGNVDVYAWNPTTGAAQDYLGVADRINNAAGSCWNGTDLYIADYSQGRVIKRDSAGVTTTLASGLTATNPSVMVYGGKMYVPEQGANRVSIFNLNGTPAGSFTAMLNKPAGICVYNPPASVWNKTIAIIKGMPNDEAVACSGVGVTAAFTGAFYVEELDRSSGIRVATNETPPAVGSMVSVSGTVKTDAATGERYIRATKVTVVDSAQASVPANRTAWETWFALSGRGMAAIS